MIVAVTTPALGHLKPMLPLMTELIARGQPVTCFGHTVFEARIRSTGADFIPYPDVPYDIDRPDFNLVRMGADLIRASDIVFPAMVPKVAALAPKLILQDFMALWGSRVGTALGIPRVHTIPTIVFNRETEREMRREDGFAKLAGDVLRGIPSLLAWTARTRYAVTLREAYGLEGSWKNLTPPVRELVFLLKELQVGDPNGDVPRAFIGPTLDERRHFQPADHPPGYALITFGTLSNTQTRRFEAAMRGAFRAGFSVVAQIGGKVDAAHLDDLGRSLEAGHPGQWARVVESVPDMEPLVMGAGFVIHHAGLQTTWESSRYRKPQLFIPTIADQKVVASKLEEVGVGLRLSPGRELDEEAIAALIGKVRELPSPWERFERLVTSAGGTRRGVDLVMETLGGLG